MAFLSGCVSPQQGDPRIILQPSVQDFARVLHVNYGETKHGIKTVDITIENRRSAARAVKFSIQWFSNGQAFNTMLSEPRRISLLPNEIVTVHEVAPNAKMDSFRVIISKE